MKRIAILATGGTIAGVGNPGENLGYVSGQLAGSDLVAAVPEIADYADVYVEQFCNVNSDDMTGELWLKLAKRIDEIAGAAGNVGEDTVPPVDAFVITHGTDTMDETAYFLSLTLRTDKPVILTGSMRPATAKDPDGPANLLGAVRAAAGFAVDDEAPAGSNVWVYFGGELFDARRVQKCSASKLQPMDVDDESLPKEMPFFDVSDLEELPRVNVVYFGVDSDPRILEYASSVSDGLVIAGAGAGEFSLRWAEALSRVDIPVVMSTRINHGVVTLNQNLAKAPEGIARVASGTLPPQKAAILLRLALTQTKNPTKLRKLFEKA
ncbi:asparaginase [Fibrobacter sp. UWEL]|uniref:asparaginase n=1 Tax=Fibrobacter sp. UWEL TaxID=1896209 RepID=UPI00091E6090|nr:asparaginase [Fibrobacter sp. UWEL]SHL41490.1 L-asparaginase [Fibrobacter sp. UWEL]